MREDVSYRSGRCAPGIAGFVAVLLALPPAASAQETPSAPAEPADPVQTEPLEPPPPPTPPERLADAEQRLAAGDLEAARDTFAQLADATEVDRARVLLGLARAERGLGAVHDAVAHLLDASRLRPADPAVKRALAEALFDQGRTYQAEEDWSAADMALSDARRLFEQTAEGAAPRDAAAALLSASRAERLRGDEDAAFALVERALAAAPASVDAWLEAGSLRFSRYGRAAAGEDAATAEDERAAAEAAYTKVLEIDAKNAYAKNGLAWLAQRRGDDDAAEALFAEAARLDPTLDDNYQNLQALLRDDKGEREKLVDLLDGVVEAAAALPAGTRAKAIYYRGIARGASKDVEGLRADLAQAAKLEPSFAVACRFEIGRALYLDNRYDDAAEILQKLAASHRDALYERIAYDPAAATYVAMFVSLGDRMFREGDVPLARDMFRVAAEAGAGNADAWNNYAFFARETGMFEESYAAYERALELDPTNPSVLNDTALILHYHLGRDLDRAAALYERAIEEGNRVLADPATDSFGRNAAQTAVRDATNNLRLLQASPPKRESP